MKTINMYIRSVLPVLSALVLFACSEDVMDRVNRNPNNPSDVPANNIFLELAASTATGIIGADLAHYASVYMELQTGVHNQFWNAEARVGEPTTSTTYNNSWENAYVNIRDAKTLIEKCSPGGLEQGYNSILGMTKILLAINIAAMTDVWGDIPYSQTAVFDAKGMPVYPQPELDKQQALYDEVFKLLDDAISALNDESTANPGGYDLVYGGDKDKWIKAANGLKAKYTMQLLFRSADRNADLNKILGYIANSFTDENEQMMFDHYKGDNWNPLGAFSWARSALGASRSYINKVKETGDYRYLAFCATYFDDEEQDEVEGQADSPDKINAAPQQNPVNMQGYYDFLFASYSWASPVYYLSYKELLFLKAEALVRLGQDLPEAKECLRKAIVLDYAKLDEATKNNVYAVDFGVPVHTDISAELAEKYFTDDVSAAFDADPLRQVMFQKYMASLGANGEPLIAYNDYRRLMALGEADFIKLENTRQFPLRYTYGNDDVLNNAKINAAYGNGQYVWSEKVWWAGGDR